MRYRDMTPEQKKAKSEYNRKYTRKYIDEHRESRNEYKRKYNSEHREQIRKYKASDVNSVGITKNYIRLMSNNILFETHSKLPGYEIHHCFGYEDPNRFIYIPKTLHRKIHQQLRDNKISADSNHWNSIRELVNSCEEYTYIKI